MKAKKSKFIIDVVPLTRIPLSRGQSFCYLSDEDLSPGTLVKIPLFRRKLEGIVLGSRCDFPRKGNIELKRIEKVLEPSFLTNHQLILADYISDYYISPLGVVIKNFVPKRAKTRNMKRPLSGDANKKLSIVLTPEQTKAVRIITDTKGKIPANIYLLYGPAASGKTEVYIHSMLRIRENDNESQFLVLVPEQTLTPQAIDRYGSYFPKDEIVVLSSNLSKGQFFSNWEKIKCGRAKVIIGTRMAVFAPFRKLGLIVLDEEQDMSYKQWDMNPRYDARKAAEKLAELSKCPLVRGSSTPAIESYYYAQTGNYKLISIPRLELPNLPKKNMPDTIVVDMKKERWQKNYSCISKKLQSETAYALKYGLQAVFFINRQGMSTFSVCADCKTVLRCPNCERALIFDESGIYRCAHCAFRTPVIPVCSKCQGLVFKNIGLGTQKVEKEILSFFPSARTMRIDSQSMKGKNYYEEVYKAFSGGKVDILIGTQMISKGWDLPRVSLVGIIDADNMLAIPDFSASSRAFQNITQVSGRVGRPLARYSGTVVIQTYQPENPIMSYAAGRDFESFYEFDIGERRILKYPPFVRLVKLTYQGFDWPKVEQEARRVWENLVDIGANVTEPDRAFVPVIRRKKRMVMLVKSEEAISKKAISVLRSLPSGWIIDVDPISIT